MSYPDWFKAQVIEAVTLHRLSYGKASQLYDVAGETIRSWVNAAAADTSAGLDPIEALEHRVARIEHYLAFAEEIREQARGGSRYRYPMRNNNGRNGCGAIGGIFRAATFPPEDGRTDP